MTNGPRSDRFGIIIAVLGGLFVALAAVLVVLLVTGGGSGGTAATTTGATTTEATTSTVATTTTSPGTTAASTTLATTTAAPTTTTTTTTASSFAGSLDDKTGPQQGIPAGRLIEIRSATRDGFARVVFDFAPGGVPGYWVGYTGPNTLTVIVYPMSWSNPYDWGIFNGGGSHTVGAGSIVSVQDGGIGAGSGEYVFEITVAGQKPFLVGTIADEAPPRLYVDVGD